MQPSEEALAPQLAYLETTRRHFHTVMNEDEYNKMLERKERRLSFKVTNGADGHRGGSGGVVGTCCGAHRCPGVVCNHCL